MHIAIAGNIGSGKTSLTKLLSKHYKWRPLFEDVVQNPYLNDFYDQMERWSFNLQVYFLSASFKQILQIREEKKTVVQDRTIYEDAYIFAANLHAIGKMPDRDYANYRALFDVMESLIAPPDLLIYLRASTSTLVNHIDKRGREYENDIPTDYLNKLNERYETWVRSYKGGKLLTINVDKLNFVDKQEDFIEVVEKVNAALNGQIKCHITKK